MPTYKKKPIKIKAFQITRENRWSSHIWPSWMQEALKHGVIYNLTQDESLYIHTLEGDHKVSMDDWVIQGVKGELYPCKPDIFAQTYDIVK